MIRNEMPQRPLGGRRLERCCICSLPVRKEHETVEMADTSRTHKICFDILCAGLAADVVGSVDVPPGKKVIFGQNYFETS